MSNIIKENQEALNEVPPLKINIAPVGDAPAAIKIEPDTLEPTTNAPLPPPIPIKVPEPLQTTIPQQQQSVEAPLPNVPYTAPPTGAEALSFGETVSRLSAQSSQEIQKILSESGQPKPNEVQKKLLGSNNPVQIDPKLTSQNNPFVTGNQPRNAAERLAFEPPILPNGLRNPFSNPNARAAIAAGISKGEYLDYIQSLRDKGAHYVGFGERGVDAGGFTNAIGQRIIETEDFTGLNADQIRQKMKERTGFYSTQRAFNQSFLPFLGEDRGSLETLFGILSLPANVTKGVALDLTRPVAAVVSGGFNVDEIKKAYEAIRPTRGGTFFGAAALGENFASMDVVDGKQFNPFAVVRDDRSLPQALAGFGLDVLLDPLNIPAVESRLFGLFRRSTVTPPPITPEVLPPVRELPPSRVAGALPPAAQTTVTVPSVVDSPISPRTPPTPERVLVTPAPLRDRINLPDTSVQSRATVGDITRTQSPSEVIITRGGDTTYVQDRTSFQVQTEDITNVQNNTLPEYKRAEPELAASYESLARYEPSEVVFPVPREPYVPAGAIVKVEPADVQLYNNVTALFNDSPELPVAQNLLRAVVEQAPTPQAVYQNRILQEIAEYGRTGELTPNIAVLKGATPDEVRAIVQDRLEVLRDTPFVVPRLEVQPIEVPKLEFDITRQVPNKPSIVESSVARISPSVLTRDGVGIVPNPSYLVELSAITDTTGTVHSSARVEALARAILASKETQPVILRKINPVKFEVVGDNLTYLAAKRAEQLDPQNAYEVRGVFVEPGSELEKLYLSQQKALEEVSKLTNDAVIESTSTGKPAFKVFRKAEDSRPYSVDLESITTSRGGAYNKEAVEILARSFLESGQNIRPIVVRRTGGETFEVIRGNLEFLAAKRASEIDPRFESVNAYIVDAGNEAGLLTQLDILDDITTVPVPTSKPVVVTDSAIASVADLQDAAKGIGTLGEVTQWSVRGDFVTPLKDVLNAVDDLGLDVLNTPALSRMVKGGIGKLSNKTVEAVASSLQKVSLEAAEDIAKSIFNALWRKATPDQKEIILGKMSATRLEQLGLERVQTKITPPTTPVPLQYVQAVLLPSPLAYTSTPNASLRLEDVISKAGSALKIMSSDLEVLKSGIITDDIVKTIVNKVVNNGYRDAKVYGQVVFDRLWNTSSDSQKQLILSIVPEDKFSQVGLVKTVATPITPAPLQYVQAELSAAPVSNKFNDGVTELPKVDVKTVKEYADKQIQEWLNLSAKDRRRLFTVKPSSEATITKLGFTVEKVDEALREAGVRVIDEPLRYKVARLNAFSDKASTPKVGVFLADNLVFVDELIRRSEEEIGAGLIAKYNASQVTDSYHVVNDSQVPIEQLRVAMLREQGFDGRTASSMKVHPLSEEIARTGKVSDESLARLITDKELSLTSPTPAEVKWSSKMLQQVWEVATPQQKAYIMSNVDNLEQLGLERIARSNVIDDHLPPEGVFDTPC